MSSSGVELASGVSKAESSIKSLMSTTVQYSTSGGGHIKEVVKGYNELGRAVAAVYQDSKLKTFTLSGPEQAESIKRTAQAVKDLAQAQREMPKAESRGDSEGAAYWRNQAESSMKVVENSRKIAEALPKESAEREKILNLCRQADNLHGGLSQKVDDIAKRIASWATGMLVVRGLQQLWSNAIDYASTYYDKLNEIRIVT